MAKKLRDEDLVLNIIINGNKSKKEMGELERAITDTNKEIRQLQKTQSDLAKQEKKDTEAYKAVTEAIKKKQAAITMAEARLGQLRDGMKITEMHTLDLKKEIAKLNKLLSIAPPGSEQREALKKQIAELKDRYAELNDSAEDSGTSIAAMASKFNHYIGVITAGFLTFMGVISGLKQINETFAEFDDKIADVQKTTGLAKYEVRELNEEFKQIDTRTQQEDLLGLARIAGKLGIEGKEDILGFVRAADQISVALTEDLGGDVEESINQIGKLVEIFSLKEEYGIEKAMLKVGSAINQVGASSSASEEYLVGFTKQVAGVAPAAGFTIAQIFGLAATLDQLGQTVEVSGTAFNDIVPSMFKDSGTFARVAGMDVKVFSDLLKTDVNAAFIAVLRGIKSGNASFGEMAVRLNGLGIDGTRATSVMSSLAGKVDLLTESQNISSAALEKGSSLTDEYNIKNQTAAANMDRGRKAFYNMTVELGEKLNPAMTGSTSLFVIMVKILTVLVSFLIDNRAAIYALVTGYIAYNAVLLTTNFLRAGENGLTKIGNALKITETFLIKSLQGSVILLAAAKALLTGNLTKAAAAMRMFNMVVGANPIAILVSLLAMAVTAWIAYGDELTAAQKAQQSLIDLEVEARKSMVSQKVEIERLLATARDKTKSDNERADAIRKLNALSPEYLGFLNLENINTEKADRATKNYIESLLKAARVKAASSKLEELERKRIDLELKGPETTWYQKIGLGIIKQVAGTGAMARQQLKMVRESYLEESKEIQTETDAIMDYIERNQKKVSSGGEIITGGGSNLTEDQIKARAQYARDAKSQIEQEKIAHQDRLKEVGLFGKQRKDMTAADLQVLKDLEKIHRDNLASISAKANKKALAQQSKEQKEAEALAKSQKEYREEMANSQLSAIDQENVEHKQRLIKAGIDEKNIKKDQILAYEALEKTHKAKLNKIDAEAITKHLSDIDASYNIELRELKIKNNEELASIKSVDQAKLLLKDRLSKDELEKIKTLDLAKKALAEKYADDESKLTEEQLSKLTSLLRTAIDTGDFSGIELSDKVFSEEELKILTDRLGVAREKIAEILAAAKDKGSSDETDKAKDYSFTGSKTDILGLTPEDWNLFFSNLKAGKHGIGEIAAAVAVLSSAYSIYNDFVSASENKQLKQFEDSTAAKKEKLENQLNAGKISQARYNSEVKKLDTELDKKKADIEESQAKRQKTAALLNIAQSTAQAIMSIWAQVPKFDFGISAGVLTGVVSALGLAQAAVVLKGKEEGGFIDVEREQDGKRFRAKNAGKKRGYVGSTSVIVSENGEEFVAAAEAVNNPTIRPVLDIIDSAQRNGSISTLNLEKILVGYSMRRSAPGRQSGGYVSDGTSPATSGQGYEMDPTIIKLLTDTLAINKQLIKRLDQPIKADVSLLGRNGFLEKMAELDEIDNSANL